MKKRLLELIQRASQRIEVVEAPSVVVLPRVFEWTVVPGPDAVQ